MLNSIFVIILAALVTFGGVEAYKATTPEPIQYNIVEIYMYDELQPTDSCLEDVANYHGVLGLKIETDGSVWFKRNGHWIKNKYVPKGCEGNAE
jgi:hypothetical protein